MKTLLTFVRRSPVRALICFVLLNAAAWAQPIVYVGLDSSGQLLGQLQVINSDGTGNRIIPVALPPRGFPSFSKDGRFLALTSKTPGRPDQLSQNVFLLDLRTAQVSQITRFQDDVSPVNFAYQLPWYHALSPDATRIAVWSFVRVRDGTVPLLRIHRVADGLAQELIFINRVRTSFTQGGDGVDWHPTQNLLVYTIDLDVPTIDVRTGATLPAPSEGAALFVSPPVSDAVVSGAARKLTSPRGYAQSSLERSIWSAESDYAPAFSPNGQQVAYVRATYTLDTALEPLYRGPSILSLRIVNLNGSSDREILRLPPGTYVTHLSWSPNGTQLVFDAGQQQILEGIPNNYVVPQTDQLWIINSDGSGLRKLRDAAAAFPVWAPAGTTFCNLPGVAPQSSAAGSIQDCGPATLENGVPVTGLSAPASNVLVFRFSVPAGQSTLTIHTFGGTGDCNLFVKRGSTPARADDADGRSISPTTTENVTLQSPAAGDYYIVVYAYTAFSGVTLTASYAQTPPPPLPLLTARITTPVDGQSYSSLAQANGTASGTGVGRVNVALHRLDQAGQVTGIFDWPNNRWATKQPPDAFAVATGTANWSKNLPSASLVPPGRYAVVAVATDSTGQRPSSEAVATFTISGGPPPTPPPTTNTVIAGNYHGLFAEPGGVVHQSSGAFNLTVNASRALTGKLMAAGKRYPISGTFSADGTATLTVNRPALSPLRVTLAFVGEPGTEMISGTVQSPEWEAEMTGYRAVTTAAGLAPFVGKYTVLVPGSPGATDVPGGDGYGTITVNARGNIRLSGALADGTLLTQSAPISGDGAWPFYVSLYGGKGFLFGWLHLSADGARSVEGSLHWERPALARSRVYPDGFAHEMEVVGNGYVPSGTAPVLELQTGTLVLDAPSFTEPMQLDVRMGANNRLINNADNRPVLTITASTGLFRGSVRHPQTGRAIALKGAVLQDQNLASGFFMDGAQSGAVALSE